MSEDEDKRVEQETQTAADRTSKVIDTPLAHGENELGAE